jgi:hypothetical protein
MKLIIIVVLAACALFWGVKKFRESPLVNPSAAMEYAPGGKHSQSPASASGAPAASPLYPPKDAKAAEDWKVVSVVHFRNRQPPSGDMSSRFPGVLVMADPDEWNMTLVGAEQWRVDAVAAALRASDVFAEECAARVWAVFVSETQLRGWDLAGALRAVLSGPELNVDAATGSVRLRADGNQIAAALDVICDGEKVENVQSPHLVLRHRTESVCSAQTELPVPTVTLSQGIATTSISYKNVGLETRIKTRFDEAGTVLLDVKQTTGQVGSITAIGGNDIPSIDSQTVSAAVSVQVGQGVVLGGVDAVRTRKTKGLFRNKTETVHGRWYVLISTAPLISRAVPVNLALDSTATDLPTDDPSVLPALLPPAILKAKTKR